MTFIMYDDLIGNVDISIADAMGPGPFNLTGGTQGSSRMSFLGETIRAYDANLGGAEFVYARNTTANVTGQTISSGTYAAATGLVTITTGAVHGLLPGATVILIGQVPAAYIGTYTVGVPSTTTFTYTPTTVPSGALTTVGTYTNSFIQPGHVCEFTYGLASGASTLVATPWTSTTLQGKSLAIAYTPLLLNQYGWFQIQGFAVAGVISGQTPAAGNRIFGGAVNGFSTPTAAVSAQIVNATYASAVSQTVGTGNNAVVLNAQQALVWINRPFGQGAIT